MVDKNIEAKHGASRLRLFLGDRVAPSITPPGFPQIRACGHYRTRLLKLLDCSCYYAILYHVVLFLKIP